MASDVQRLQELYSLCIESLTDRLFYTNVHSYFSYIHKNPKTNALLEALAEEYYASLPKQRLRKETLDNPFKPGEVEIFEEAMKKADLLSPYAWHYTWLEGRIYLILENYFTTSEDVLHQDPAAIIMLYGEKGAKDLGIDTAKSHALVKWYKGQRESYTAHLKQFHIAFINRLRELEPQSISNVSAKQHSTELSKHGDVWVYYGNKVALNPRTKTSKVLTALYEGTTVRYLDLVRSYDPKAEVVTKTDKRELMDVIKDIKEKLGILPVTPESAPDIIENMKLHGYRLKRP